MIDSKIAKCVAQYSFSDPFSTFAQDLTNVKLLFWMTIDPKLNPGLIRDFCWFFTFKKT